MQLLAASDAGPGGPLAPAIQRSMDPNAAVSTSSLRAVVADDDPVVRMVVASALRSLGLAVEETDDGSGALEAARRGMPDLVVLDVQMPAMDGFEACAAIRELPGGSDVPILIVTGLDEFSSIDQAFAVGATDFLTKPINTGLLQHRVRFQMRASRAFRELRGTLAELGASQHRLAKSQDLAHLGDWEWRVARDRLAFSERASQILGCCADPPLSSTDFLDRYVHPDDRSAVAKNLHDMTRGFGDIEFDHRLPGGDRVVHHFLEAADTVPGGELTVAGTVQDITDRRKAEQRIRELAFYDTLTGLPNRKVLEDRLQRGLRFATRARTQTALLFLALDRFKRINDTLGHTAGDRVLKEVAERLVASLRAGDHLARTPEGASPQTSVSRFGGDEFAVVLSGLNDVQDAGRIARRLLAVLREPLALPEGEVKVTASIGIAVFPADGTEIDTLFRNADMAMHHAKEQGRDNHQFFSASMNEAAIRAMRVERALGEALERGGLLLHYQPQVRTASGDVVGAEALVRMQARGGGLVLPDEFIPVAEESGLIVPLGAWVLREACMQFARWRAEGWQCARIAVNVSTVQLRSPDFLDTVDDALAKAGLEPQNLELELTEGVFVEERGREVLRELRSRGVAMAIDDFGTGFSSLSYLNHLPVDVIKIDRSFIREIDAGSGAIVGAIIALARGLGCTVVAEGVETEAEVAFLTRHGCDVLQGFYFGHPVSAERLAWRGAVSEETGT